ncbi:MAG: beta-ketoacyl-ACP synthase III [Thermoguttaceae bacterium]
MSDPTPPNNRGLVRKLTGVQVLGTGSFLPDQIVRNEDLAELGFDADWIIQRTGIRERRHAPPEMATSDMAVTAAERCIKHADVDRADIDLVLVATFSPDYLVPATACLVQDRLGLVCPAMDISAACAGFLYSIITGMQSVATGCSKLALVIGADCNTRVMNPADKKTFPLFGDGAGAVLLGAGSDEQGMLAYLLGSDGSGAELLYRPMGGSRAAVTPEDVAQGNHFVRMDGRPVFKWAVRLLESTISDVLAKSERTIDDVDLWLLHQANARIIDAAVDSMGIDRDKVVVHLDRYGNTSAASVPIALDESLREGRIKPGAEILMSGYGAGLSWGTGLFKW